ncbi:MAG: hypothetical protein H0A74_00860 [Candidatus Vesicomyosocius endoextente]|uniref:Uncharacterized protein n=1 Tax=Candidatus Vesicomyosocius endoextente TaxID=2738853 RepID=A0A853G443_9GAMM|nr:hypothetical protein [Candidatus Vesicomyosocius endoextente]
MLLIDIVDKSYPGTLSVLDTSLILTLSANLNRLILGRVAKNFLEFLATLLLISFLLKLNVEPIESIIGLLV